MCLGLGSGTGISAIVINQRIWLSLGRCPRFAARANAKVKLLNIQDSDWMTLPKARFFFDDGLASLWESKLMHQIAIHLIIQSVKTRLALEGNDFPRGRQ